MMNRIRMIMNREEGASAVEYGLLVAGIAAVIVLVVLALGSTVGNTFKNVNTEVGKATAVKTV